MKSRYFFFFFILVFASNKFAFSQTPDQLQSAYAENSPAKLKKFLDSWAENLKPLSKKEMAKMNNHERQAYAVFEAFYNPHELSTRGGSQFGNDAYTKFSYFIIPPKLNVYTADKVYFNSDEIKKYVIAHVKKLNMSDDKKNELIQQLNSNLSEAAIETWGPYDDLRPDSSTKFVDSIVNFRPRITQTSATPLYLTAKYKKLLTDFLGNTHVPFGQGGAMNIARAQGDSKSKMNFLENHIKIYYGHWGGYWNLLTPPVINSITFDKDFKFAKVDFQMIYEGGRAFLGFEDGKWKIISAKMVWKE